MAWTTPLTAVANTALTAAQWNASVRDNLLTTPAALATTAGRWFVTTGANAVAERAIANNAVNNIETSVSTAYTDLTTGGPAVTVTTGTQAIAFVSVRLQNQTAGSQALVGCAVSGASTVAASDNDCVRTLSDAVNSMIRATACIYYPGLTAGSSAFTMKYRVSANAGTFAERALTVMAL